VSGICYPHLWFFSLVFVASYLPGLRIKENKEVYEGEVTELTPEFTEAAATGQGAGAGYGKVRGC
jgi:hypothetical protein